MEDNNMKKIYINPEMAVIKIATQQMMATSNLGYGDAVSTAEGAESRSFDFDDEEEDW